MNAMTITINISEEEIVEAVKERVVANAVAEIEESLTDSKLWRRYRQVYADAILYGVRYLLKKHLPDITDRAVKAASVTIANRGTNELVKQLVTGATDGGAE